MHNSTKTETPPDPFCDHSGNGAARTARFRELTAGAACAGAVFLVLGPVLLVTYGIYDSARMAHDFGWTGESRMMGVIMGGGRFLYAWFARWGFSATPYLEDLWMLRLIGVAGLALTAWLMSRHALKAGWTWAGAVCIALAATLNPGAAVYGFWSACFPYGAAIAVAFLAGLLWERERTSWRLLSMLLLQASLLVYQPAGLYFLAGPLISWFGRTGEPLRPFRTVWSLLGILTGLILHVFLVRLLLDLMPGGVHDQAERLISGGLRDSLGNVAGSVLPRVLSGWGVLIPGLWALLHLVLAAGGILLFLFHSRGMGDRLGRLLALAVVGAGFIPALISADGYTPFRLLAPAYALAGIVVLAGYRQWLAGRRKTQTMALTCVALALTGFAAYGIQAGIIRPREAEASAVVTALEEMGEGGTPEGVTVIRPEGSHPFTGVRQLAEYGAYETTYPGFSEVWMALVAAKVYGWEPGGLYPVNQIHWLFYPAETRAVPSFYPLIDLRRRLQGLPVTDPERQEGRRAVHPHLGECRFYPPNLYHLPGHGLIQQEADRWFFMTGKGWMQWLSEPGERPLRARNVRGETEIIPFGE
ncbi:MAG: hypothetical protein R6V45_13895 [Oceanipulchritudo sp.]